MDCCTPAIEIIKLLSGPLSRQINYVRKFGKNLIDLKGKRDILICKEKDVSKEITRAKLQRKEPKDEVQNWLERVAKVKEEISDIEKEYEETKMGYKNGMPNYCRRRTVSKRSLELIGELEKLTKECSFEGGVAVDLLPATTYTFATKVIFGEEVIDRYTKQIWECLANENIGKIGVYGMGGVGKTMIMTHINNHLKEAKLFDNVIWVTVSKELNLKGLQGEVAKAIHLNLSDDCDEKTRSGALSEALSRMKKFVLILDDVWKTFRLEEVGIPEPSKENGAKMVLTARSSAVCNGMETQKNIKVDVLPENYAWDLFSSKVEKDVLTKSVIENEAKLVAKECKGLPLALITVGLALRNAKYISQWRNALKELKGSTHDIIGMEDEVFMRLKFSYTHLRDDRLRKCFLYCSLYPEDYIINKEELIKLWMWEGLIDENEDKEAFMDKGSSILNELIDACMLEKVRDDDGDVKCVKMHDLIRDMAIGITRDRPRFMVKTSIGLKEQPKEVEFGEDIERISLSRNNIASLIGQPNCPKLRTLFLNGNHELSSISSTFFLCMHGLRVLDLSWTKIVELPVALSDLVNLHALLLVGCRRLVVLPSLAKLKELRILNLSETCIEELPRGMEGLTKLKYLDLSYTLHLKTIRVGIVLQLSALEELSLIGSPWKFDLTNREAKTIIDEISALKRLDKLSINFEDMQSFLFYRELPHWRSLHKFVSVIEPTKEREEDAFCNNGEVRVWTEDAFCNNGEVRVRTDDTNRCSVLYFDDHHLKIKHCWCNLMIPCVLIDSRAFKTCEISSCTCTEYIFEGREDSSLSTIDTLRVEYMKNLKSISKGEHHGILQSLRILDIHHCPTLKTLFSSDLLQSLQNIEVIVISGCESMEQMVVEEVDGEDICEVENIPENAISLPRLRVLQLEGLDNLKCICKRMLICNFLQQFRLLYCPQLNSLSLSIENPITPLDGCVEGTSDWWNTLHWEDPNTKTIIQPLFVEKPFRRPYFRRILSRFEGGPECSIM